MRDILDWVVDNRKKSAGLLYYLLLNGEDYITQHMEILTTGMFRACSDDEKEVVRDVRNLKRLVGCSLILMGTTINKVFSSKIVLRNL